MKNRRQQLKVLGIFLLLMICLLNAKVLWNIVWRFEHTLIDFRFSLFKQESVNSDIVIVDIDTSSINKLSHWPWPRHYWGKAVQTLNEHGASVIGFDFLFDSSSLLPDEDIKFAAALAESDNVVLASRKHIEKKESYEIEIWSLPISSYTDHADFGFINYPFDSDGFIRKALPLLSYQKETHYFSFDAIIASQFLNKTPTEFILNGDSAVPLLNDRQLLYQKLGYYINFNLAGSFKHIPFYLLLENRILDTTLFKNKIVLLGATDPSLNDFYFTPLGLMSGVDLHAHSILTLLKDQGISRFNPLLNFLITLIFLGVIVVFSRRSSAFKGFIVTTFILMSYSVFAIVLFSAFNIIIFWAPFLILGVLTYVSLLFYRFIQEESEKRYIQSLFSQYVSPEVVKELIQNPQAVSLGGEKKEVSIFFSDIRSFTSLSEQYPPEEIVDQLNEYLEVMSQCIFKWQGTLDKYVGDEIMAIWGAPTDQEDHVLRSVCCAWEQLQILQTLHQKWRDEGKPLFDIGIGINTGTVLVGNIGSTIQKDYTVIGDDVNYAARLEATTRDFSSDSHICRFIISHSTYAAVKEHCTVKKLGTVQVKGKEKSHPIFEVESVIIPDKYTSD